MTRVRRPILPPGQLTLIAESTPQGVERKRRRTLPPSRMREAAYEVGTFIKNNDWSTARAIHFVALYLKMHLEIYGVEAADCGPEERLQAAGIAGKMLEREFGGEPERMVDFVHWVWKREAGAERWRRENGREGRRISWMLQFSSKLLLDYKVNYRRTAR